MKNKQAIWGVILSSIVALVLWTLMFSPYVGLPGKTITIGQTAIQFNFWWMMAFSALMLTLLGTWLGRSLPKTKQVQWSWLRVAATGIAIAAVLWVVFWIGDKVSSWMFSFARPQVTDIYAMKHGMPSWLLTLLLLFLIGPAEELFWRGYVQRTLCHRLNPDMAFVYTLLTYTLVHFFSLNFMLVMAALVCGTAWGLLYRLRPNWFGAIIVSHAVWDAAVFVWFPI